MTPLPASPFLTEPFTVDAVELLYHVHGTHPLPHMNEPWPEGCEPTPIDDEYAPIREILERYCGAEG